MIDTFILKTQQQGPVLRQIFLWKEYKNCPITRMLTINLKKEPLQFCRFFKYLSIKGSNLLLFYIQETKNTKFLFSNLFVLHNVS